ncbi:MAG: hypothetical protein ACK5B6_14460 [Bacteroidia bacterium]|jgi:hypothetical protein
MKRFKLSEKQGEIVLHVIMCIVISTILFVLCLVLVLFWNGLNYVLDYTASINYPILWYVYLVCWVGALVIDYFYIKAESKSSRNSKLWNHEIDRRYIGDAVGEDYFEPGDPYGD